MRYRGTYRHVMSQHLDSLTMLRLKAAAAVLRRDPGTARSAALRFPELRPVPIRSAVLPLCHGFAVIAAVRQTMRSTHLDDLPQLLNVIRGQMSLVGPRPERPHFTLLEFMRGTRCLRPARIYLGHAYQWSFRH